MNNIEKMAKLFADRTPKFHVPVAQGNVISIDPLQVQFGDSIILTKDHLVINKLLAEGFTVQYADDNGSGTVMRDLTIKDPLQVGDAVILFPDKDHKVWYLIAKVGTLP